MIFRRAAALALVSALAACAPRAEGPDLAVEKAWSRPASAGGVGGGFAVIENRGATPVTVVSMTSPQAERIEFHQSVETGGVYSMKTFPDGIVILPHGKLVLGPGGYHAMLVGLKSRTEEGQTIPATLTVRRGETVWTMEVQFAVRATAP